MILCLMKSRLDITSGYFNITWSVSNFLMHLPCRLWEIFIHSLSLALSEEKTFVLWRNVSFDNTIPSFLNSITTVFLSNIIHSCNIFSTKRFHGFKLLFRTNCITAPLKYLNWRELAILITIDILYLIETVQFMYAHKRDVSWWNICLVNVDIFL